MKRIYLALGLLAMTLFACDKAPALRLNGVPESITQLISDDCFCDPRIGLFKWDEQLFYVHWIAGPACDGIPSIFDEQGHPANLTDDERRAFWEEKELVKMIWVCEE